VAIQHRWGEQQKTPRYPGSPGYSAGRRDMTTKGDNERWCLRRDGEGDREKPERELIDEDEMMIERGRGGGGCCQRSLS
jgi:hypothetical protein